MLNARVKRIYEDPRADDGVRVLVDRLWPRGVSKVRAKLDSWEKCLAPGTALRTGWHHDPEQFSEFAERYRAELKAAPDAQHEIAHLRTLLAEGTPVTLLYAARDPQINHAQVLAAYLNDTER